MQTCNVAEQITEFTQNMAAAATLRHDDIHVQIVHCSTNATCTDKPTGEVDNDTESDK